MMKILADFFPIARSDISASNSIIGLLMVLMLSGCALFHWDLHAPGILSSDFAADIQPQPTRLALYIPQGLKFYESKDKGTSFSDPQTYHIGEAFVPMLVESFQQGFEEFILIETEPTEDIMTRYGISYLAVVEMQGFRNRKDLKGQGLDLFTATTLFGKKLNLLARFETKGASDARKVFAKKGGPEVNLNAAIESNLRSVILSLQDWIQTHKRPHAL